MRGTTAEGCGVLRAAVLKDGSTCRRPGGREGLTQEEAGVGTVGE